MKTVVFSIENLDTALAGFRAAWTSGKSETSAHVGFSTWELMHKALSPKRLEIVRVMAGAGPLGIREVARRVGRDFKGVHTDVKLLVDAGVVDKDERGRVVFPYDKIHVDFEISAAA
jgi:predicted transcriptional regulator